MVRKLRESERLLNEGKDLTEVLRHPRTARRRRLGPRARMPSPTGDTVDMVFVSDLRHFLDMPEDAPGPARRIAEHLTLVVRAATAGESGQAWVTALPCRRRPGRRPCKGQLAVFRTDVPASIEWRCTACRDEGVITGWEQSPFDLRRRTAELVSSPTVEALVTPEVAATLRSLLLVDTAGERLVFRARPIDGGVVLAGDDDDLEELLGYLAAEANDETNRRRQKRLDQAFEMLNGCVEQSR